MNPLQPLIHDIPASSMCYLAAPYSSTDSQVTEDRINQFLKADAWLMSKGVFTVSPLSKHFILRHQMLPGDWRYWQAYSERLMAKCDVMLVLTMDGWVDSVGVIAEMEFMQRAGKEVIFLSADGKTRI